MAVVEESEYKGNPMIVLRRSPEDRYPFQFGLSKAKLVLDAVEEIKAWVTKQEADKAAKAPAGGEE
jgi:hypothetical protein